MGYQLQMTLSNAISVKGLKVQICDVMRFGLMPQELEIRLGDVTLEDQMPLHFYGIKNGSKVDAVKFCIGVTVENNNRTEIYWNVDKRQAISDVKVKLTETLSSVPMNLQGTQLYFVRQNQKYDVLTDGKTLENYDINDGDNLYLLSYKWSKKCNVIVTKTKRKLHGVEREDICLGIKVKMQHQLGIPASTIKSLNCSKSSIRVTK